MNKIVSMSQVAEDAGHMGYSSIDYPGCPSRLQQEKEQRRLRQENIEMEFDSVNKE